jgi:ABC-2 type transport system permease protein
VSANRHASFDGIGFPVYFMTAMATLGTMAALISSAAVIAADRSAGWTRQVRITPLRAGTYLRAKVICGYLRALLTIGLLCLAGTALGVRLSAREWLTVIGLLIVGLIPFAVLGILLGHLIPADSSALAVGAVVTLFALLSGVYGFQIATSGAMFEVIKGLPSYWLVQAGKSALGGSWPAEETAWGRAPETRGSGRSEGDRLACDPFCLVDELLGPLEGHAERLPYVAEREAAVMELTGGVPRQLRCPRLADGGLLTEYR